MPMTMDGMPFRTSVKNRTMAAKLAPRFQLINPAQNAQRQADARRDPQQNQRPEDGLRHAAVLGC